MNSVVLKPELRTPGGETVSIYLNDEWAGDLYLVYREGDILTGTIQIDTGKVSEDELDMVGEEVRMYIQHLTSALDVDTSSVVMMYGDISSVVEMEPFEQVDEQALLADEDVMDDEEVYMDMDDADVDDDVEVYMADDDVIYSDDDVYGETAEVYTNTDGMDEDFHLSVVYEDGEHTKYHLHNEEHSTVGVVAVDEINENVSGRVEFWKEPSESDTSDVARMLARTFGDAPQLSFTMNYEDQHLGDMHLEHGDYEY
jgi:hypothetical protein